MSGTRLNANPAVIVITVIIQKNQLFDTDHAILSESLHLSIPAHQNRIIAGHGQEPDVFNTVSTMHNIGGTYIYTAKQIADALI